MNDIIYVPLSKNFTEAIKKRQEELIISFVVDGWERCGILELKDSFNNVMQVTVLARPIK